eukprot:XP_011673164.1 PREDICTED: tripartite motif-containing protein 5-like [Strongylocentrotus purpuratus]
MASKFPAERDEKVKLHPRKGHDMTWSCDIHGEPIAFYCKEHGLPVCDRCAIKDHQKPCHLENVGDVILELVGKLDDKRLKIEESKPHLQNLDSEIQICLADARNHLQTIDGAVNVTFESKTKSVKDMERDKIRSINDEAEKDIRTINEKREKRIKSCNEEAERQQLIIKECHAKVLLETKEICKVVSKKIKDLTSKNQHAIITMNNIDTKIKRIKQDDKTLVNEAPQVLASLDDNLSLNVHQDVSDCIDRIQREVQKVKFVEGEVGGEHYGRIDGYIGKWELVKSIHIPSIVDKPWMLGLTSDDEIYVWDLANHDTYVANISSEQTEKVNEGGSHGVISTCASIDSNVIVCGKRRRDCAGNSLDECINLYDRQWKVVRDITIPRNYCDTAWVHVDVDRDGMILAAQRDQSNIYVINPADGKIVNTITMQGKVLLGEIRAVSSGDIVMLTGKREFTVISRSGVEKSVIHCDEWFNAQCSVDKLTDTLYITYWDEDRTTTAVDQVSCDGIIQAKRIVEYELSDRLRYVSPCFVTPTGNLVACDSNKLFVFEKRFIV